ncbi:hypothetical protein KGF56_003601 [Candida oxycetoniae]|uniref:RRM domain-containing protein n=1 Tax=Candida oxycetoniae TaxID=497107 RepID=A0AAI9SVC0_9ASCO|nr:uncharacterized protein KGF56_003601 [Candida oxycetoniae]KAI3403556.2 hypothetical protein KGF56_003601 [Candida oxycetoniae]
MTSVIASNIPTQVSSAKVREFFSFCGKINDLIELENNGKNTKSFQIVFASPKAVTTALLLNDAELENSFIKVEESSTTEGELSKPTDTSSSGTATATDDKKTTGDKTYDDVDQEDKPKFAILAQLLADGYVLSDAIIERGTEFDKKNGISERFNKFIKDLDEKYVHSQDPNSRVNQQYNRAQDALHKSSLWQYFSDAAKTPLGTKIHQFYLRLSNDVMDVHGEAKRLAQIKREKETTAVESNKGEEEQENVPKSEKIPAPV